MRTDLRANARQRCQTFDVHPDGSVWAVLITPALASYADHNPAVEQWRELRLDPRLAGLAADVRQGSELRIGGEGQPGTWLVPVAGPLATPLAWHPELPLVAGLAVRDGSARPWIADYQARNVREFPELRAATSLVELQSPPLQPLVWFGENRLLLLTPAARRTPPAGVPAVPVVYEARGPAHVAFEPDVEQLAELAGVNVSMLDVRTGRTEVLTSRLLVRGLATSPEGPVVEYADGELRWNVGRLGLDGLQPTSAVPRREPMPEPSGLLELVTKLSAAKPNLPDRTLDIPTGHGLARLTVWRPAAERTDAGSLILWIHVRREGRGPSVISLPTSLAGTGYSGAVLDLPLHWPSDATVELLHEQVVGTVRASLESMKSLGGEAVLVGGHSFGATLALYALAHVPELAAAIVHNGCYNRTLTPTGFQYERRPYWQAPALYHAFSALLFADRIDRPVLIVHGAEDSNPATTPDQAVLLYQGIVAAGGHARLVLLPHEDHLFQYQETQQTLVETHREWLARWDRQPASVGR